MDEDNLTLLPLEELPETEEREEVERINILQDNLIYLMEKNDVLLSRICEETMIPLTTAYSWYRGATRVQLLDINVKELASYFDVPLDELAFVNLRERDNEGKK